jgi:hypothetical protein
VEWIFLESSGSVPVSYIVVLGQLYIESVYHITCNSYWFTGILDYEPAWSLHSSFDVTLQDTVFICILGSREEQNLILLLTICEGSCSLGLGLTWWERCLDRLTWKAAAKMLLQRTQASCAGWIRMY